MFQIVYALRDVPEAGIRRGEHGTIVEGPTPQAPAYWVEFVGDDGSTRALEAFPADQLAATPPPP